MLTACPDDGIAIFFQTDIKRDGRWLDKGYLVMKAAEAEGSALLWHRILCRRGPGMVSYGRPAYTHILAFSRTVRLEPSEATADVIPEPGPVLWARAFGLHACEMAVSFIRRHAPDHTIVDPFCGEGTVLAVANALGMPAVGVDHSRKRCRKARELEVHRVRTGLAFTERHPPPDRSC